MSTHEWYKLDTAAQLFPLITNRHNTSSFRLGCVLKELVDPKLLLEALKQTLERFPMFKVRLKKGVFWYYFEENDQEPIIREESPLFTESNDFSIQRGFLFNLSYNGYKVVIEIFHALTDGTGGIEFFKSILYHYLLNKGYQITNHGEIITGDIEELIDESQNSFKYNYPKKVKRTPQEKKGFRIPGQIYHKHWIGCIQAIINLDTLKAVTKRYNVTVTEYISAIIIYQIYYQYVKDTEKPYPIRLFVPVNVRKYFNSKTLKNFVLFIRTNSDFTGEITFDQVIEHVKTTFSEELNKEKMLARLKANVDLETQWYTRYIPLFIKQVVVKLIYKLLGSDVNTLSFSNLGVVKLPSEMIEHLDHFEFSIGASKQSPVSCTAISCGNKMTLTFATAIIERDLQKAIFRQMITDGVDLVIETNDLEVK